MHLWEVKHSYYMNSGNYHSNANECHFDSLEDFKAEWGNADLDYNRIHRWDWIENDPDSYDEGEYVEGSGVLYIFYVLQRKADLYSCSIDVTRYDEQEVIEFLKPHARQVIDLWSPMITDATVKD
jgi:hypothetical protein